MWCDAMLVLIHAEWPRARQELLAPTTSSTHAVVQAWMQATQVQVRCQSGADCYCVCSFGVVAGIGVSV
jgi:hypothetical protein